MHYTWRRRYLSSVVNPICCFAASILAPWTNPPDCAAIKPLRSHRSKQVWLTRKPLRRIKFHDAEHDRDLVFLTNNFDLPALTIAQLYRFRWQVELFFKWIKQHLRIKNFYGTTENAVKTQIWIAISVYVLVAIVKKRLKTEASLYTILQILSLTLLEKTSLVQLVTNIEMQTHPMQNDNQLNLFN
jgi:transposase